MATKQQIVDALQECLKTEESAIPVYTKHLKNTLFLSGFSAANQERFVKILNTLAQDSERHRKIYEGLLSKVSASAKDTY